MAADQRYWLFALVVVLFRTNLADGAKILATYKDPRMVSTFLHLVRHNSTGHIYVGAVNRVYDLDSDLKSVHSPVETGPKDDSLNCQPREGEKCFCLTNDGNCEKVPTDSVNQALAISYGRSTLYACSNLFYGSCSKIRMSDFTEREQGYKPVVSNEPSISDSSAIVLVAPGLHPDGNLYIATTRSNTGHSQYTDAVPLIASRDLDTLDLSNIDLGTSTSITPLNRYKDTFKVYYRFGYSYEGFTYFLAVQKSKVATPGIQVPYGSRIMRVCQKDGRFHSYTEVKLTCPVEGYMDDHFKIVQAAYIAKPGVQISDALNLEENDQALFVMFTTSGSNSHTPRPPSALCVYSLKRIAQNFKQNQEYCFRGEGTTGPKHITTSKQCIGSNFEEFECGETSANSPIQGHQPVSSHISHKLQGNVLATSIVAKAVGDHTVIYVGEDRGNLIKVRLIYYKESRETRGTMFSNTTIDPGHPILSDMTLDDDSKNLYMMSNYEIFKVQLTDCARYTTCDSCVNAGDPHCGWCSSLDGCTQSSECPDAQYVWIKFNEQCPNIKSMTPDKLPYTDSKTGSVKLEMLALPEATDNEMRCKISTPSSEFWSRVFSNSMDRTLTCDSFEGLPSVPEGQAAHNVSLAITVDGRQWISVKIAIYDCSLYKSCIGCSNNTFPCVWCLMDGQCVQQEDTCPSAGPIVVGTQVDVISSPAAHQTANAGQTVWGGPGNCPYIEQSENNYIVASGHSKQMNVMGRSLKKWATEDDSVFTYPKLKCAFQTPNQKLYALATVEELLESEALIKCEPTQLSYVADQGILAFPFDVEWEFGAKLENPQNIEVSVYKCSSMVNNCGKCLTLDPIYECGWCQSTCTLKEDCPNWLDRDSVCPNPRILRFEPGAGPINGGTKVRIHGMNLGKSIEEIQRNVLIGKTVCRVLADGYEASTSFMCQTQPATGETSGPVSVTVAGQFTATTKNHFRFTSPTFLDMRPTKGLVTGGNLVAVVGEDMDLGNNATVHVQGQECTIEWRNSTHIIFKTPKVDEPTEASVRITIDGSDFTHHMPFNYIPNPQILELQPFACIVSGGNTINVTGTNFDGVQMAYLSLAETLDDVILTCQIADASSLQCTTPSLIDNIIEIPENYGKKLDFNVHLDRLILTKKELVETMEYKPIVLYGDPIINPLETPDHVIQYEESIDFEIKGENLAILRNFPKDWMVLVGGTIAPNFRVNNFGTALEVFPPEDPIHKLSDGRAEIEVRLGNFVEYPGFVQYPVPKTSKVPLILGLVFGLAMPIIMAIILIIVCLRRQSKKNSSKSRRALLPDSRYAYQPASMLPPPSDLREEVNDENKDNETRVLIAESPTAPEAETEEETIKNPDYVQRLLNKIIDKKLRQAVSEVCISKERIEIGEALGHGHFGCVYSATLRDNDMQNPKKVAVKTLQGDDFPPQMVTSFLEEGVVMKKFDHPHVLRLLGVGVGENDEPMVIIPYMANGDLRTYVRNKERSYTARQLLKLAQQVANGMAYLASLNFVHRDLAARNCMIDELNVVKVADFGLSKNLFEKDYYSSTRDRKTKLPVKWMALESLEEFRFTIKSDVWSFGVLMWELMTRGTTPYPDVDIFDLRTFLSEGRRLPKPKYCPEHVYSIMTDCWNKYPENRPTFADLVNRLELLLNPPKKRDPVSAATAEPMYVNFSDFDTAEYLNPISAPSPDTPLPLLPGDDLPPAPPPPSPPPPTPPKSAPPLNKEPVA